jgi:hypothetical protein
VTQSYPNPDPVHFFEHEGPQSIGFQCGGSGIFWIRGRQGRAEGGKLRSFFDPIGHSGTRDTKRAGQAAQTAALLRGRPDLLAASWWIDMGSQVLAELTSARAAAIQSLAIWSMTIACQSVV